jgi:hypothetical protein
MQPPRLIPHQEKSHCYWLRRIAVGIAAMLLLGVGPAQAKPPKPTSCAQPITACGCVITQPLIYTVANDLSAAQTTAPNCIEIAASNAILNVMGFHVLGNDNGTGIGILIRKGADNVIVEGGLESSNVPPQDPVGNPTEASNQAKVNLWDIGIEDDGNGALIALFSDLGGSLLQSNAAAEPTGNTTAGLFLNGVTGSFVGDFNANFNGKYGVLVTDSRGITLANFTAAHNKETGLRLDSSNDDSIGPAGASSNSKDGMVLLSSSRNTIHDSNGNSFNGDTGIVLGCASGDSCPGNDGSKDNRIVNAGAPQNTVAGIVIQNHSTGNTVTVTHNQSNGGPSDMIDLNPDCDNNTWYNNVGSANQSCIH